MMVAWNRERETERDLKAYILKIEVTRLNERPKSLIRREVGLWYSHHVPLSKVGKTRFGMMGEKKKFLFLMPGLRHLRDFQMELLNRYLVCSQHRGRRQG